MPLTDDAVAAAFARPLPSRVVAIAAGRRVEPIWLNDLGGVTYALGDAEEFVKVGPPHEEFRPDADAARLRWLAEQGMPVPTMLGTGVDATEEYEREAGWPGELVWFHTAGLPGENALEVQDDPAATVAALGRGLRRFHDALPVDQCPFEFSVESRCARRGLTGFDDVPPLDLVVCHGDACNPNFLVDRAGPEVVGYVDLGLCGVADRWADLVMALGSLRWNFPGVDSDVFLAGYGVDRDEEKLDFYTRLWRAE